MTGRARQAVLAAALLLLARDALAQQRELLRLPQVPRTVTTAKLTGDLAAAASAGAVFYGVTDRGLPVIEARSAQILQAMTDRITSGQGGLRAPTGPVARILEVIASYSGSAPTQLAIDGAVITRRSSDGRFVVVRAEGGLTAGVITALAEQSWATSIEPNYPFRLAQTPAPPRPQAPPVNDPVYPSQWGLQNVHADLAWSATTVATPIIAVIDSGVDATHVDLKSNISSSSYDVVKQSGAIADDLGHGTHVAGIIGAIGNNGEGIAGVVWKAQILAVRVTSGTDDTAPADMVASGILYAIGKGARIINLSLTSPDNSPKVEAAVKQAVSSGLLVVAAAGNEDSDNDQLPMYPANLQLNGIISVMASDTADGPARFPYRATNFGAKSVHIAAPGANIFSLVPKNAYAPKNGTSMAAPFVSAAAALVWSLPAYKQLNATAVRSLLMAHARPSPTLSGKCVSGGVLDLSFLAGPNPAPVPKTATAPAPGRGGAAPGRGALPTGGGTPEGVQREMSGIVKIGVMAIGGETTGIVLKTADGDVELKASTAAIRTTLLQSDGKSVTVRGTFTTERGVEIPVRRILTVSAIVGR